jgi:hypothetical protein
VSSGTLAGRQLAASCGVLEEAALASGSAASVVVLVLVLEVTVEQQTQLTPQALRTALGAE